MKMVDRLDPLGGTIQEHKKVFCEDGELNITCVEDDRTESRWLKRQKSTVPISVMVMTISRQ
jgi:hypothetical protein